MPEHLRDPDGAFWGFTKRARIIVYRKDAVRPEEVATMDALGTARFRDQIVMRSSSNVYQLSTSRAHRTPRRGERTRVGRGGAREFCARSARQRHRSDQGGSGRRSAGLGLQPLLLLPHGALRRPGGSRDGGKGRLCVSGPAGAGTHINISGGGVTSHAKRRDLGVQFLEYLVSDEAQTMLAPLNTEFPIRPEIAPDSRFGGARSIQGRKHPARCVGSSPSGSCAHLRRSRLELSQRTLEAAAHEPPQHLRTNAARLDGVALAAGFATLICAAAIAVLALPDTRRRLTLAPRSSRRAHRHVRADARRRRGRSVARRRVAGHPVQVSGARVFEWALAIPLAAPSYILAYAYASLTWAGGSPIPVRRLLGRGVYLRGRALPLRLSCRARGVREPIGVRA
ncbi:MAG: ABC transporter substrate-binding protein [Caulobacteraceae bacterium]|nr:ABC transporter substrate-binding protein [Caulobacteraceae bacterium]